jgi:putative nucleotidyltransferase-like protein
MPVLTPAADGLAGDPAATAGPPRRGGARLAAVNRPATGRRGVWPTTDQELLLRAAFPGDREAGCQWIEGTDLDEVDPGSFQLLPQLYRNLSALSVSGPVMERLRGVYRYSWSANAVALRQARLLLECLEGAGVTARVIGPVAFLQRYYRDLGARLVDSVQLLIQPRQLQQALSALRQAGLASAAPTHVDRLLAAADSTALAIGGRAVVLDWSRPSEPSDPAAGSEDWETGEQIDVDGSCAHGLTASDDLLFVLIHATRWEPVPPFRWLADAMAILRSRQGDLDWDRLLYRARAHGVVLPVRQALGYLHHRLGQPIPAPVLTAAEALSISLAERVAYRVRRRPPVLFGRLPDLLFRYLDQSRGVSPLLRISGVVGWLQRVWGLPSPRQVPAYVVRRAWARAREASAGQSHLAHRLKARR